MEQTVKHHQAVADSVCGKASGFGDLEPWVRQLLALFPVPSADLAGPLFEALLRVAQAVPWLEAALGYEVVERLAPVVDRLTTEEAIERADAVGSLVGTYDLSGTIVGTEAIPRPGPENLRAALWVCHAHWSAAGNRKPGVIDDFAAAIRGAVKVRSSSATEKHAVAKHLPAIEKSNSLEEFLAATRVFLTSEQASIKEAWGPISSHLAGLHEERSKVPPIRPPVRNPSDATGFDEDEEIESLIEGVRRISSQPPDGMAQLMPGEPSAEVASTTIVSPITGSISNPDAKRMAEHKARQVVWSQNSLLLTNHPDVLPEGVFKRTLTILVGELLATDDTDMRLGLAGLLLEAVTGRTCKSLVAIKIVDGFGRDPVGHCELSLAESAFRLRVFFARDTDAPNGYFRPTDEQSMRLESVAETFLLPLPAVVSSALGGRGVLEVLATSKADSLDEWIREAAKHVSQLLGMRITAGQVRRSFSAHLFESCRDTALTQLICADTLGQSEAPSHYYAPRASYVSGVYRALLTTLFGVDGAGIEAGNSEVRVGSRLLVRHDVARQMTSSLGAILHTGVEKLVSEHQVARVHEAMVSQVGCMLMSAGTHRPVDALFELNLTAIDLDSGAALFQDKIHDPAHDPRLVVLPSCVIRQLKAYLGHLAGLTRLLPELASRIKDVMAGKAPLLFALDDGGHHQPLSVASFAASLPPVWRELPLNWGRTWVRTRSVELGLGPELASIQLGHLEAVGYPFSNGSPTEPAAFIAACRPLIDRVAIEQGWVVRHGACDSTEPVIPLSPLRSWASSVRKHEQAAKELAKAWRDSQKARVKDYRRRAEEYVLADKTIIRAGIDVLYASKTGPWAKHSMSKEEAEALRDVMFEDAGADTALGLACSEALHRILRWVNKRVGMQGQEPARLTTLRRPVDNAFVPGMMVAVRQIRALREAALQRSEQGPGDWKDFALACARVAHALAVFGFCDDPMQIEGVLAHRNRLVRSAALDDVVLVHWGSNPGETLGVRGLAALAVARLAKKYPGQAVPPRQKINEALAALLPDWAVLPNKSGAGDRANDLLALLCETVSVANRFELSPAARMALHSDGGSVCAHPLEQIALLDADPLNSLKRHWEIEDQSTGQDFGIIAGKRTGNARSQYLALCRAIPTPGKDLELPLTDQTIAADQLIHAQTREKVIAEVKEQLAAAAPNVVLHPIVRFLATWVLEMLEKGTQAKSNPADRTISTYLTRIGGGLVEVFGNSSLPDLDDAELEDAYRAVVEAGHDARDKAAAAILDFHDCCSRNFGLPELDLSEIRAYLTSEKRSVDACLVLPAERDAAVTRLLENGKNLVGNEAEGRQYVRVVRQAAAAMPLYAYAGSRRSEILGLKFTDVAVENGGIAWARIRANRSRRLKTRAARRTVQLFAIPKPSVEYLATWVDADRSRLHKWRHDGAYVFAPLKNGRLATGRAAIADVCLKGLAEITGRRHERLHRLRHLVAFERITPLVLSERDHDALSQVITQIPSALNGIVLPRDMAAQVITLGHAHWVTTLRCYYHLPWLLRSNADAVIRMRYMNRRGAAAVMGLTLPAVDRITQQSKPTPAKRAWLDHVLAPRLVPKRVERPEPVTEQSNRIWTANELGQLLKHVERTGSLESALTVMGGHSNESIRIRKDFLSFEKRLGRRLVGGEWLASVDMPRRIIRDLVQASPLEGWWRLFDEGCQAERKSVSQLAAHVFDWMAPGDGDAIKLEAGAVDTLAALLAQVGFPESAIERQKLELEFWAIRVLRLLKAEPEQAAGEGDEEKVPVKRYLGLAVKRTLGVIWVADRMSNSG